MPSMWLSDTQKIGVAFCSGGVFFFLAGIMMLFDRAMLAMGNVLLLIGITILIGPQRTFVFFLRRDKLRGTAALIGGITVVLVLRRLAFIGFFIELYGLLILFGDFLATLAGFVGSIPVVGPWIAAGIRAASGGATRNVELPV